MNVRTLLAAARANGWRHKVYDGSLGVEHVWERGDLLVGVESRTARRGEVYQRLTIQRDGKPMLAARVDSVAQAAALLAVYGITPHGRRADRPEVPR